MNSISEITPDDRLRKWASPEYARLRRRRGWSIEEAMYEAQRIRETELAGIPYWLVVYNGLDNPFATPDARRVLKNAYLRNVEVRSTAQLQARKCA